MGILVVDDSIFIRKHLKDNLSEGNPNVEFYFASSYEEGYNIYLEKHPCLIITELLLPNIGQDFIAKIRAIDQKVEIIALTDSIPDAVRDELSTHKITAFFHKPLDRDVIQLISGLIED